jgi:hypothetical protein
MISVARSLPARHSVTRCERRRRSMSARVAILS